MLGHRPVIRPASACRTCLPHSSSGDEPPCEKEAPSAPPPASAPSASPSAATSPRQGDRSVRCAAAHRKRGASLRPNAEHTSSRSRRAAPKSPPDPRKHSTCTHSIRGGEVGSDAVSSSVGMSTTRAQRAPAETKTTEAIQTNARDEMHNVVGSVHIPLPLPPACATLKGRGGERLADTPQPARAGALPAAKNEMRGRSNYHAARRDRPPARRSSRPSHALPLTPCMHSGVPAARRRPARRATRAVAAMRWSLRWSLRWSPPPSLPVRTASRWAPSPRASTAEYGAPRCCAWSV